MRPTELTRWLVGRIREQTGLRPGEIDIDLPLRDLGLSSTAVAELASDLTSLLGTDVHPALAFEYPTIRALADALGGAIPADAVVAARGLSRAVAIVGMSVRVPGADSVGELWRLLLEGRDPVAEVPPDRWRLQPGWLTEGERGARFAGLLTDIASFDAEFFQIPPEEAMRMDPQQRLLLQGAWEALEDAGQVPARLAGSSTGVYVGISNNDYVRRQLGSLEEMHALTPTANAISIAANRLSYQFDLRGPSLAVDTACSSSLVAVHLAVRDLRAGSCDLAIVGGVNLLIEPEVSVALARAGMLAPDGRCKPFDSAANGYVRAEGCLVVVLKPLDRALSDGDRVYAVIQGSSVNQDGRTNGLTAPNPAAQQAALRAAYADAHADPRMVQYVECHGTGTLLGDPIEARALGAVVGAGREAGRSCLIGSVKSNLGHLESAAGLAGLVKAALSLHHGRIPGTLHFRSANPHIDLTGLGLQVADGEADWPGPEGDRLAGVSSFGFGGTNAHIVLAPRPASRPAAVNPPDPGADQRPVLLPVSARHPESLAAAAQNLADHLDGLATADEVNLLALAATMSMRRTHHSWRAAVIGTTAAELAAALRDVGRQELAHMPADRRLAFAFSGQTGHSSAALLALARSSPLAAATLRRCDEIIEDEVGWSLLAILSSPDADRVLRENTEFAQPAAVAAQLALAAAWQGVGIRPTDVIGHSLGEVAAAAVAGALSPDQALRVALARGRVISQVVGTGRMLAMAVDERAADEIAASTGQLVTVATINGPSSVVLSGDAAALERVRMQAEADGTLARWVPVDYPSHSPRMAGPAADLVAALGQLDVAVPNIPFWSSVHGGALATSLEAEYWGRNLSSPVRFADAASALLAAGPVTVIEVGTRPVLRAPFVQLADGIKDADAAFVTTMEQDADPVRHFYAGLARLYELGADLRWDLLLPRTDYLPLPSYPWRRKTHWLPRAVPRPGRAGGTHPLLGVELDLAFPDTRRRGRWELQLTGEPPSVAVGHVVGGRPVLPGAGYLEMAMAAGRRLGLTGPIEVRDARFAAFLPLAGAPVTIQTMAEPVSANGFDITVMSRRDGGEWLVNATATVLQATQAIESTPAADLAAARAVCFHPIATSVFYDALSSLGLDYSGSYRGLDDIWYGTGTAVARLGDSPGPGPCVVDPRTLDAALQLTAAAARVAPEMRPVVTGARRLVVTGPVEGELSAVASVVSGGDNGTSGTVTIFAGQQPVVTVEGLQVTTVTAPETVPQPSELHWYEPAWRRQDARPEPQRTLDGSAWLVVACGPGLRDDITARLREAGAKVITAAHSCEDWRQPFADLRDSGNHAADVIYLAGLADEPDACQVSQDVIALASLVRAVAASDVEVHRLWLVTLGSQDVAEAPQAFRPGHGAVWGLVRVLPFEIPNLRAYCVDLDAAHDKQSVAGLIEEFCAPSPETEVALRRGRRYVARITASHGPDEVADAEEVARPGASYLITGGMGAIGLQLARWLSAHGAGRLGLLGRRPPGADVQQVIAELELAGTKVSVFVADVADRGAVGGAVAELRRLAPIHGVAHAAGVLQDGALLGMSDAAIESVLRPKVAGTLYVDAATRGDPLDWIVYFSSAASVLGSPGQANYCAANAFLDSYGDAQRSGGRPVTVVNWGAWADAGLAVGAAPERGRFSSAYAALDPVDAITALGALLRARRSRTMVLASDLRHLVRLFPAEAGTARFSELVSKEAFLYDIGLGSPRYTRPELKQPYAPPRNALERRIAGVWERSLGFRRVGVNDSFFELGGDSVFANQMLLELNRTMGVGITAAAAFDELTVARLAELAEQDMLLRLESMSEEEAERLLRPGGGG